jgi:predicted metalloprotease with PDZ domain
MLIVFLATTAFSQPSNQPTIRYTVSFAGYRDHLLHIQCQVPPGDATQTIQLPVWNALYQVRDFAQYVTWFRAHDLNGAPLVVHERDKSSWRIEAAEGGAVLDYEIFADNSGPYGAQLNSHHAFLNLAEVLAYPVGDRALPLQVRLTDVPAGWKIATSLASTGGALTAPNYDQLVDAPIEAGAFQEINFDDDGGHYRVAIDADVSDYDTKEISADLPKIVHAATTWMTDRPFDAYTFLYHFPRTPGGGGMEHAYSTAIDIDAETMRNSPAAMLSVSAHEFFHLWNVKRIRPQSLEPIDYTQENYTPALWFSEGMTSTVAEIILLRAGLTDERRFLDHLGRQITELQSRPAHRTQAAEDSSRNAWLEKYDYYRRPERSISYYNKGELLGVLLDLSIRESSHGRVSLRELFQWMNQHYAKEGKFFPDSAGVREAAEAVGGGNLATFFERYVAGTDEIPWDDWLRTVGLHVVSGESVVGDAGFTAARNFDAPPSVLAVDPQSEAARAGLAPGDIILTVNGQHGGTGRAGVSDLRARIAAMHPGEMIKMHVRNESGERDLQWKITARQESEYVVKDLDVVTSEQRARRAAWLKGEAQAEPASKAAAAAATTAPAAARREGRP